MKGRRALVCGASKGIGWSCARALAGEGARVLMLARDQEALSRRVEEINRSGGEAGFIAADLSEPGALPEIAGRAKGFWNGIDILVNNTGGPPPGDPLGFSTEDWLAAFRAVFLSVQGLTQALVKEMCARGWGRVVNLASVSVLKPLESLVLSNSLRMAVLGWARSLAVHCADRGVTVNTIATGYTRTDRIAQLLQERAVKEGRGLEELSRETTSRVPAGRMAECEEIAAAVLFLASEKASYVTGAVLPVDGGFSLA